MIQKLVGLFKKSMKWIKLWEISHNPLQTTLFQRASFKTTCRFNPFQMWRKTSESLFMKKISLDSKNWIQERKWSNLQKVYWECNNLQGGMQKAKPSLNLLQNQELMKWLILWEISLIWKIDFWIQDQALIFMDYSVSLSHRKLDLL